MKVLSTRFQGLKLIRGKNFYDKRGYFREILRNNLLKKKKFIFWSISKSKKNVLRGLHGDNKTWKLVSCPYGECLLVVVNFIKDSRNYLKHKSWILSHENGMQILIPPNYANGHLCLSKKCLFHYKLSYKGTYADQKKQFSLRWNDPMLGINWRIKKPILSKRDKITRLLQI